MGSKTVAVLHDAATTKIKPIVARKKQQIRNSIFEKPIPQSFFCGYAGSLHSGRGINVLFELAKEFSFVNFVVIGGNDNQIRSWEGGVPDNVIFLGQKPYKKVVELLPSIDSLNMPYQATFSLGNRRYDTGKWMSPLKMFEYMASGVPI